jgi:hypothetical protein
MHITAGRQWVHCVTGYIDRSIVVESMVDKRGGDADLGIEVGHRETDLNQVWLGASFSTMPNKD